MDLDLNLIVFDEELKVRVQTDSNTIRDYFEAMETEDDVKKFPPPTVYFDGCRYWLADGHHRYRAVERRKFKKITVRVIDGTHDEAILAAVKLNMNHGLRFKEGDWEKIITLVVGKKQWASWTNRRLAEELHCGETTIRRYRPEHSVAPGGATEKRQGKDGKMYKARKNRKRKPKNASTNVQPTPAVQADEPVPPNLVATPPVSEEVVEPNLQPTPADETSDVLERFTERECLVEEKSIFMEISAITERINRYFDRAPEEHHDRFADRLRTCIRAMID